MELILLHDVLIQMSLAWEIKLSARAALRNMALTIAGQAYTLEYSYVDEPGSSITVPVDISL